MSNLSLPAEETATTPSPRDDTKSGVSPGRSTVSQGEAPASSKGDKIPPIKPIENYSSERSSHKPPKQTYPLYPSVAQLLHEESIPISEADKIPASGPKGRLLKGDVLAYLGRISSSYASTQSARISKLGHPDFSNVEPAPSKEMPNQLPNKTQSQQKPEPEPVDSEIAVPISLSSVLSVQKRIQTTLGVALPLSTFIARATELANEDLPRSSSANLSADELFNDVLGLNEVRSTKGGFIPQLTAFPKEPPRERSKPPKQPDVYDTLSGHAPVRSSTRGDELSAAILAEPKTGEDVNVFSVSAAKGEEKRARVFLERVKTILQVEPGRLIL